MRNISQLVASLMLLATQANAPFTDVAASVQASAQTKETYEVSLQTNTSSAVVITGQTKPNYDAEVLAPLHAAQAAAAAKAVADKAAAKQHRTRTVVATKTVTVAAAPRGIAAATPQNMQALRYCEAGGIYTRNSGNGYYGAYQYNNGTWAGYGGYARADLAPASVQDAKFMETYAARGWSPWPSCARSLGLM
jgi:hypothetical protein